MALPLYTSEDSGDPSDSSGYLQKLINHVTQNNLNTTELEAARQGAVDLLAALQLFSTIVYMESYVNSMIMGGGAPGDIAITALGVGTLADGEMLARVGSSLVGVDLFENMSPLQTIRFNSGGTALEGFDDPITEIFKQNYLTGGM